MKAFQRFLKLVALLLSLPALAASPLDNCFTYLDAGDYVRAEQSARQAIRLSPASGPAMECLGRSYHLRGELDLALRSYREAERLYSRKEDLAYIYTYLGQVLKSQGDSSGALNYYSRALALQRELRNRDGEAQALNNIAGVFAERGDSERALDYYNQSLKLEEHDQGRAGLYNNIAMLYSNAGDEATAVRYLDQAISVALRAGDLHAASRFQLNKGSSLMTLGDYAKAEASLNEGLTAIRRFGDKHWEMIGLFYLGDLARARSLPAKAREAYEGALALARATGANNSIEWAAARLASLDQESAARSFAVVEIGAKGVKAAAVTSQRDAEGRRHYTPSFKKSINTNLIKGVTANGEFSAQALEETTRAVAGLVDETRAHAKNVGRSIFVVGSSAISSVPNRDELILRIRTATGITPTFIDSSEELSFAILSSVPDSAVYKSSLLDIGSGNGRFGFLVPGRNGEGDGKALAHLPVGSVSLAERANQVRAPDESYRAALERVVAKEIEPRFADDMALYPNLRNRDYLVLVGGAAWAMATLMHPEERGDYVPLTVADMRAYFDRTGKDPAALLAPDLTGITDAKAREAAAAEIAAVKGVFTVEELQAGARLLKMAADHLPLERATIYFSRHGNWANGLATGLLALEMQE